MIRYGDVLSLVHSGQLESARQRVAEYAEFTSTGQFTGWAITKITDGLVCTYRGRFPEAIRAIEQALAALNAESSLPWRLPARLLLARAYAALGQPEQASRVLADAQEHTGAQVAVHQPARMIAESWLVAARGGGRPAAEAARKAAAEARRVGQYALEAEALHHAARFGDRTVAGRIAELARRVAGPVFGLQTEHAAAVAAHDAEQLDALSVRFEDADVLLSAADAAAQAAVLHAAAHRTGNAAESTSRARQLAASCGDATTPALRAAVRPLPISEREREIALLIAEGLTSREIADRLVVSARTVEGHIYRACIKLDVSDRDELAAIVRAHR
jgi:DNA-binding CsgD family transcriptional regulator